MTTLLESNLVQNALDYSSPVSNVRQTSRVCGLPASSPPSSGPESEIRWARPLLPCHDTLHPRAIVRMQVLPRPSENSCFLYFFLVTFDICRTSVICVEHKENWL